MSERINTMVGNIVSNEIMANASHFVQELCSMGLVDGFDFVEQFHDCMVKDDYREPVEDAVRNGTPAMLWDICDHFGLTLYTIGGRALNSDNSSEWLNPSESIDRQSIITAIDTDHAWQEVAEHLDIEPFTLEALEHWIVSDWLAEKLEEIEAPICRDVFGWNIWGRTETGQSLTMDSALHDVARLTQWQIDNALNRAS